MKKITLFIALISFTTNTQAQSAPPEYYLLVKQADSLYEKKQYQASAETYSAAFKTFEWKGFFQDRYNAGCSWALAKNKDSAFFQFERIADKSNFQDHKRISDDKDLKSLHDDKRWEKLIEKIKENQAKAEAKINKPLKKELEAILEEDQKYRIESDEIEKKYGMESKEMDAQWDLINQKDSINILRVTAILDQYGWLGQDVVGYNGSLALFLVIQHANLSIQEKYLPMMREAVKEYRAQANNLALLEDRVALGLGKKQIYGSQLSWNEENKTYYLSPLEDPDKVDERRALMNLSPIADYLKNFDLIWDLEQYKKDLPKIEEWEKRNR